MHDGRIFHVVGRQIREQYLYFVNCIFIAFTGKVGHAAFFIMGHGAAQVLEADFLTGNGFDYFRAGNEHKA